MPDYGRLSNYRSASGMGIRLDAGTAFAGAVITPFYDSLLVKVTAHGLRFVDAARRMERCLQEFRVRGVKTNIPFLHQPGHAPRRSWPAAARRASSTRRRSCSSCPQRQDRATKLLTLHRRGDRQRPSATSRDKPRRRCRARRCRFRRRRRPAGAARRVAAGGHARQVPRAGPREVRRAGCASRNACSSPTRRSATPISRCWRRACAPTTCCGSRRSTRPALPDLFSLEMWGGATFDTSMRFLKESPWQRLAELRERVPNILFQMLLRAANAVGYTNYPDNVVQAFVKESAQAGIDLFRIFDALNWLPNLQLAIEAVRDTGMLCEAAICYTGDILDPEADEVQPRSTTSTWRRSWRSAARTCSPSRTWPACASRTRPSMLVRALQAGGRHPDPLPHARLRRRADRVAACWRPRRAWTSSMRAMAPFSGMTSQPSLNALVEALRFTPRDTGLDVRAAAGDGRLLGGSARAIIAPFETRPARRQRGRLSPRDARRPVHEPVPAGAGAGPGGPLARGLPDVRRGQPAVRRHRQGDADVEGRRRHGPVHGRQQPDAGGRAATASASWRSPNRWSSSSRAGSASRRAASRRSCRSACCAAGKPMRGRPGATLPPADFAAARRTLEQTDRPAGRRPRSCDAICSIRASSPTSPRTSASTPTPACCRRRCSSTAWSRARKSASTSSAGKTLIIKFLTVGDPHVDGTPHGLLRAERPAARGAGAGPRRWRQGGGAAQGRAGQPADTSARRCRAWWCASRSRRASRSPPGRSCSRSKR